VGEPDLSSTPLERALRELAAGRTSLADVRAVLGEQAVVVPTREGAAPGEIALPVATADDGTDVVPLFSSVAAMQAIKPDETDYAELPFTALLESWPLGTDAVLDPGHDWALRVPSTAMRGPGPMQVPAGTRVAIGEPEEPPTELLAALREHFGHEPAVERAWCAQILLDIPGEEPHTAIGVRLAEGRDDPDEVCRRILEVARPSFSGALDLLVVEPDDADPIAEHMVARIEPFYTRGAPAA
jgi:hypothetical protein